MPAPSIIAETGLAGILTRALYGKLENLADFAPADLAFIDSELDEVQQQAVRRAIATPEAAASSRSLWYSHGGMVRPFDGHENTTT